MNISINGIGIVSAIGIGAEETLSALQQDKCGIAKMQHLQSVHTDLPVGEVRMSNEEMKQRLGLPAERIVSRTTLMGALAMREATKDISGDCGRTVVISGTTVGGMDVTESIFARIRQDGNNQETDGLLQYIKRHDCGSNTQEIVDILGLKAEVCTISTACSAALNAIAVGCEMLKNREVDTVIAGGTEALSLFHLNGFNSLMILDHEPCRPFCKTRQGLNLGEGAAYVVLRREDEAMKETECQGRITGYANRCDAWHQTATSPNGEGAFLAMTDALRMAGLKAEDIDYVNAHGTGTPDNDRSESAALKRVFGEHIPPVSSTKALTGHTTSASGAIETVISIIAMKNKFIPAETAWREQDDECITPCRVMTSRTLNNVMCNSFGFGGNDSSLIISSEKYCPTPLHHDKTVETTETEVFPMEEIKQVCVTLDTDTWEQEAKEYISPKEARRMGKLLKAATMTSLKALRTAGIERPDAIITATKYGMLENSERLLTNMTETNEQTPSPTLFMQSTHNTIGSAIAIRLGCHGYNITYTQGDKSMEWAMRDALRLIATNKAKSVLVGFHDEVTPLFLSLLKRMGEPVPPTLFSKAIVLIANEK